MNWKSIVLTLGLSWAGVVHALEPVLFGPEFTFMPDPSLEIKYVEGVMSNHLVNGQPEGSQFVEDTGFEGRKRFTSPNGWWFVLYRDSGGVEVNMSPMTVKQYRQYAADIHDAIFVSAANSGMFPALWQGGGHINIDATNFKKNPLLFRNFIVDLLNHNELFMGIFNYDFKNGGPHHFPDRVASGLDVPNELDSQKIYNLEQFLRPTLHYLDRLWSRQQLTFEIADAKLRALDRFGFSFWLAKLEYSRLEIRAVRPQASIDVFIRQIELFEQRLKYLEKLNRPIEFAPRVPVHYDPMDSLTPPIDPQLALRSFYDYVTETGLKWSDHRDYLWPQWQTGGELEKFEASQWFLQRQSASCASQLQ